MIFNVDLISGTSLSNVRYTWIVNGASVGDQSVGITQPDAAYSMFRIDTTPPVLAEELIVFDVTNFGNWNVGLYRLAVLVNPPLATTSPTLSQMRILAAAYLRVDPSVFIVNGVDLFLVAANSARLSAELEHDFEYSRVTATLDLTAAGSDLRDATIIEGEATAGIKSIVGVRRLGVNGFFYPLDFTRWDIAQERDRSELELYDTYGLRYPGDQPAYYYGTNESIVQRGHKLMLYPGFSSLDPNIVTLYIDGYGLLRDYGTFDPGGQPEDFIVQFGPDYLQWAIICDLNKMLATFVPRQEGNLPEPTAERDAAWKKLVLWDSWLVDSALTRSA